MSLTPPSNERETPTPHAADKKTGLVVLQPNKLEGILQEINSLSIDAKVSERSSEDRSTDMGTAGAAGAQTGNKRLSAREAAIAAMPAEARVLRQELEKHISLEVKSLQKEIRLAAKRVTKPGAAYRMNLLYARLRRLEGLLRQILEASYDTLKRLFVRIFIDQQKIT